jgi:hypothetical protein
MKNSTTIILPEWFKMLDETGLATRTMPRDVSTRWHSTYDMLNFALDYRVVLDSIIANRDMKLRQYELSREEWKTVGHLQSVLKVCSIFFVL